MPAEPLSSLPAPVSSLVERKDLALRGALEHLAPGPWVERPDTPEGVVTAVRRLAAGRGPLRAVPGRARPAAARGARRRGMRQLYTHQAEAYQRVIAGEHIVVTTPTASGKTLCYNLPVLDAILQDPSTRALYLFPTKALAQDQLAELHELVGARSREAGGERSACSPTTATRRRTRAARSAARAHVVLSNPDMLHSGILPHHPRWAKLFENLQFVVIDELHAYRGVFGSHLANVLRRLQRICRHYGSDPTFICSSATIANPRELAERLTERPFELVDESGAPRGEKFFLFVNPPVVNARARHPPLVPGRDAPRRAASSCKRNLQLIVFAQSRLVDRDPDDLPEGRVRGSARARRT